MIKDCDEGKIDMVITKSISRFARNTLDCLNYTRKLKSKNIAVFFEKENINSLDSKGEVLLTIMASLAQQESESLSANVRLGLQFRYQQGKVQVNHNWFLGYTKDEDGNLVIEPEEAVVVKRIYREFLYGRTLRQIKNGLESDGILNGAKHKRWYESNLLQILTNEKYIGDALLQKTYTVDLLEKKREKNNGQLPKYYVEKSHDAIIPKEVFYEVKEELIRRANLYRGKENRKRIYTGKYALSGAIICEKCGDVFRRINKYSRGVKAGQWKCVTRVEKNDRTCSSRTIDEEEIHNSIVEAINELYSEKCNIIPYLEDKVVKFLDEDYSEETIKIDKRIKELQESLMKSINNDKDIDKIGEKINKLKDEKEKLLIEMNRNENKRKKSQELLEYFKNSKKRLKEYDDSLVRKFIDQIIVHDDYLTIQFKNGMQVNV